MVTYVLMHTHTHTHTLTKTIHFLIFLPTKPTGLLLLKSPIIIIHLLTSTPLSEDLNSSYMFHHYYKVMASGLTKSKWGIYAALGIHIGEMQAQGKLQELKQQGIY